MVHGNIVNRKGNISHYWFSWSKHHEQYPTNQVYSSSCTENNRPALRYLQDVTSQVDSQKSRNSTHSVHQAEDTTRVIGGQILGVNSHSIVVESRATYNNFNTQEYSVYSIVSPTYDDSHADESSLEGVCATKTKQCYVLGEETQALNQLPNRCDGVVFRNQITAEILCKECARGQCEPWNHVDHPAFSLWESVVEICWQPWKKNEETVHFAGVS